MSSMAFYGYQGNPYDSNWALYSTNPNDFYADFPPQSSSEYSAYEYEFNDLNLSEFSNPSYSYYACTPPEPRLIQYCPPPSYAVDSFDYQTKFSISYSNSELNEPEAEIEVWDEYDPTPYGGGYDPIKTYGKPLPPSDKTCYPRSSALDAGLLDGFSYNSTPAIVSGSTAGDNGGGDSPEKALIAEDSGDSDKSGDEAGETGEYGGYQVPNIVPYGSGLESLDLCESVFGYWPCLAKMEREKRACEDGERRRYDPWEGTAADYLFGSPFPYDDCMQIGGNGSSFQYQNLYAESQH